MLYLRIIVFKMLEYILFSTASFRENQLDYTAARNFLGKLTLKGKTQLPIEESNLCATYFLRIICTVRRVQRSPLSLHVGKITFLFFQNYSSQQQFNQRRNESKESCCLYHQGSMKQSVCIFKMLLVTIDQKLQV